MWSGFAKLGFIPLLASLLFVGVRLAYVCFALQRTSDFGSASGRGDACCCRSVGARWGVFSDDGWGSPVTSFECHDRRTEEAGHFGHVGDCVSRSLKLRCLWLFLRSCRSGFSCFFVPTCVLHVITFFLNMPCNSFTFLLVMSMPCFAHSLARRLRLAHALQCSDALARDEAAHHDGGVGAFTFSPSSSSNGGFVLRSELCTPVDTPGRGSPVASLSSIGGLDTPPASVPVSPSPAGIGWGKSESLSRSDASSLGSLLHHVCILNRVFSIVLTSVRPCSRSAIEVPHIVFSAPPLFCRIRVS